MKLAKTFSAVSLVLMIMPMLSAKYYARVVDGYKYLMGRVVIIEGTIENELGIKNIWRFHNIKKYPEIQWYKDQNPPPGGSVYYGIDSGVHYCFHETWIKILPPKEAVAELLQQEDLMLWISPDGTIFGSTDLTAYDAEGDDDKEDEILNLNKEDF